MKRRGNGEGTIRERSPGHWEARFTVPSASGQQKRRSVSGTTRAEVARQLTAALQARNDQLPVPGGRLTTGQFLEQQWFEAKATQLRPESLRRYGDCIRLHLVPALGRIRLAQLSPADVQAAHAALLAKGLSGTTVQQVHGVLRTALADAERWGLVARNVARLASPPRRSTPTMDTLTPEEAKRLLGAAVGDALEAFYVLALTAGLRLGELQALRWRQVDLDARRLQVIATYQGTIDGEPVFAEPKTARSRRNVHLSALAVEALRRQRAWQAEQRLRAGVAWQDHGLVFTTTLGRPLDGNNLRTRSFARLLERAGLPPMRFHSLRHGAATLLMADGVPVKAISELLGHSDVTTTLRLYAHVLETTQQAAADSMDRRFGGNNGGRRSAVGAETYENAPQDPFPDSEGR